MFLTATSLLSGSACVRRQRQPSWGRGHAECGGTQPQLLPPETCTQTHTGAPSAHNTPPECHHRSPLPFLATGAGPRGCGAVLSWGRAPAAHRPCVMTSACCYLFFFPPCS